MLALLRGTSFEMGCMTSDRMGEQGGVEGVEERGRGGELCNNVYVNGCTERFT